MESCKPETRNGVGLVRNFKKVRFRSDGKSVGQLYQKNNLQENLVNPKGLTVNVPDDDREETHNRKTVEALLAELFARISAIKAAYAQLQIAQYPYDPENIQTSDQIIISEMKKLSEIKHGYKKKQELPHRASQLTSEVLEQENLLKTYQILAKKLQSEFRLKDSELIFLKEKLHQSEKHKKSLDRRINGNNNKSLSMFEILQFADINPNYFIAFYRHTIKSIRSFVKVLIAEMKFSEWNLAEAASYVVPHIPQLKPSEIFIVFEYFVCAKMFNNFDKLNFSLPNEDRLDFDIKVDFFDDFMEMKNMKPMDFLSRKPYSPFGQFCRAKYLDLIHPRMESSFFGDLTQRNSLNLGEFPCTRLFMSFTEMAKRIWLLHRLAFSFQAPAIIFQAKIGSRFSEVYMKSIFDDDNAVEACLEISCRVSFSVVPGFQIGKTVIPCRVFLSDTGISEIMCHLSHRLPYCK